MDKFRRRPPSAPSLERYGRWGLSANPFPPQPVAEFGSPDARTNGSIFDPGIRPTKVEEFRRRFVQTRFGEPHSLMGYLMSLGAVESTRGMGKTAMLLHFAREVNEKFGPPLVEDQRIAAVYVSPIQGMKRLDQLSWATFRNLVIQLGGDVFVSALLQAGDEKRVTLPDFGDDPLRLLDSSWLEAQAMDLNSAQADVRSYLVTSGVDEEFAAAFASAWGNADVTLSALHAIPERRRLARSNSLLFDTVPSLMRAAGFTGLLWLVDELENVVNSQNANDRVAWAKELRTQLIDAPTMARQHHFILPVFVTHTLVHNALSQAWTRSGLDQLAPMHREIDRYTVQLEELTVADSTRLVLAYLDHFRVDAGRRGELAPFSKEAVTRLAGISNYHPREILRQAYHLIERAAEQQADGIGAKFVSSNSAGLETPRKTARRGSRAKSLLGLDD